MVVKNMVQIYHNLSTDRSDVQTTAYPRLEVPKTKVVVGLIVKEKVLNSNRIIITV